ncbi:MAG: DHHA1 domain-containing protein, partial [bacterium]
AMALFGEKYGDWVRVVEVEDVSRELCGGTHVANTAEIGVFKISSESSSAANVRRIEALTGPAAVDWYRERSEEIDRARDLLGGIGNDLGGSAKRAADRLAEFEKQAESANSERASEIADSLAAAAEQIGGTPVVIAEANGNPKELLDLADRIRRKAGDAAVVLGGADGEKASLAAVFGEAAISAGLSAKDLIGDCAGFIGGGGGGRENAAQAGGKSPEGVPKALAAARSAIEQKLS